MTAMSTPPTTPSTPPSYKPRIRRIARNRYLVESKSRPGVGRQVDVLHLKCSCPAGKSGLRCWHLTLALAYDEWRSRQLRAQQP